MEKSGTGLVYESGCIITNAHVVKNARQIYVQPYQSPLKLEAKVVHYASGIDLAIIKPIDPYFNFFKPIEIDANIPLKSETVKIYGYPMGGSELAVSEGVVSRLEYTRYNEGVWGLRIQVDAAINPGNSGGPAYAGDLFVGIVFSKIIEAENIGYVIPNEEIKIFLDDVSDGVYHGKNFLSYRFENMQNQNVRRKLGLQNSVGGQLVSTVSDKRLDQSGLRKFDVLLQIGPYKIDRTGMVNLSGNRRLRFQYLIPKLSENGQLPVTVIRDGETFETAIKLSQTKDYLLPYDGQGQPKYFIYGPLTFARATQEYVETMPTSIRNKLLMVGSEILYRRYEYRNKDKEELIICPKGNFAHSMMKGLRNPIYSVLKRLNGIKVKNLDHLVEILRDLNKEDFAVLEFSHSEHTLEFVIILNHGEVIEATPEILSENGIRDAYSFHFKDAWTEY